MSRKFQPRAAHDRRVEDVGPPPGWKDRRVNVERRMIQVTELPYEEFELHRSMRQQGQVLSPPHRSAIVPAVPEIDADLAGKVKTPAL